MLKLSANISLMFGDLPLLQRPLAARKSGFRFVEIMYPYETNASDLADALAASRLELTVLNLPPGDQNLGEKGLAAYRHSSDGFRRSLMEGLAYAQTVKCKRVHLLTGNLRKGDDFHSVRSTLVTNIREAADFFGKHGIKVLLEPLSRKMLPDYSLTTVEQAVDLIDAVGRANVRLQLDLYHTQMEQGNLSQLIHDHFEYIDYVQVAGVPGRHEPDVGEIHYPYIFKLLEDKRFDGPLGCEYVPQGSTTSGLKWAHDRGYLAMDEGP